MFVWGRTRQIERAGVWEGESRGEREREREMVVLTSVMAPIIPVPLHAVAPQVQAQKSPTPSSICKLSPRAMASAAAKPENGNNSNNNLNNNGVPKMEPFSRSRISRLMREPSLLEKAEHALGDRCTQLEGDEAYRCWEALFEFENIKKSYEVECETAVTGDRPNACRPLERFENLVRQSGGVSGLIDNVRMVARNAKVHQQPLEVPVTERPIFPEDGGIPAPATKGSEKDQDMGVLPESDLTRMLRHQGRTPAWFTHPPDHESD